MTKNIVKHEEHFPLGPQVDEKAHKNIYKMLIYAFFIVFYVFFAIWPDRGPAGGG